MQIKNYNNSSIKFKGIYALKGQPKAVEASAEWVAKLLKETGYNYSFKNIQNHHGEITLGVATHRSIAYINKDWFDEFAQKKAIDAHDLIDPTKTIRFNFYDGFHEKVCKFKEGNKEFICSVFTREYDKIKTINQVKFDKPKPLREALSELFVIPTKLTLELGTFDYDKLAVSKLLKYNEKEIKKCFDSHKFYVKGLIGKGGSSTALELANGDCLKLSNFPNAPLEDEIYDIQTIYKDKLKLDKTYEQTYFRKSDFFYYTVQKKGLGYKEQLITPEQVNEISRQIMGAGHYWQPGELDACQIALLEGKPYLVDAQVPENRLLFK